MIAGIFKALITEFTDATTDVAVAATTLLVVAVLTPLKNQIQVFVDRYFKEEGDPLGNFRKLSTQADTVMQVLDREKFIQAYLAELLAVLHADGARVLARRATAPRP